MLFALSVDFHTYVCTVLRSPIILLLSENWRVADLNNIDVLATPITFEKISTLRIVAFQKDLYTNNKQLLPLPLILLKLTTTTYSHLSEVLGRIPSRYLQRARKHEGRQAIGNTLLFLKNADETGNTGDDFVSSGQKQNTSLSLGIQHSTSSYKLLLCSIHLLRHVEESPLHLLVC